MELSVDERLKRISLNIAYYRKLKRLTQQQLADKAGISKQYLARLESPNSPAMASMDTFIILADALEIEPKMLLDFRNE